MDWIRKELRAYKLSALAVTPGPIIALMDCVFFGRTQGWLVVRDPHRKVNVYWSEIERETLDEYRCARDTLEGLGYEIQAVVADGKPGLKPLYEDIPIQMCHFHMKAIITRYLTRQPRLQAGIDLRNLVHDLRQLDEQGFAEKLQVWHSTWREFLSERTVNPETGRWHYTHKRLRSAHRSLKNHLPYLFTYQKRPDLNIPNTTNGLEGSFAYLKELVRVHRGIKPDLMRKIIDSILQNRPPKT